MSVISNLPTKILRLRNGRQMLSVGRRLGVPLPLMRYVVKGFQVVRSPRQVAARRIEARRLLQQTRPPVTIADGDGYARFSADEFPEVKKIVEICQTIRERADDESRQVDTGAKKFLRNLLSVEDLAEFPEILKFATSEPLIATATQYLGAIPQLVDVKLWSSVPTGEDDMSSQLFHRDNEDFRQVKLFLNVYDVTEETGPLTAIPASISERVAKELANPFTRTTDDEMFRHCSPQDQVGFTGRSGEGVMLDTSRCFHFGSRARSGERLVFVLGYMNYTAIAEVHAKTLKHDSRAQVGQLGGDRVRELVMTGRPSGLP
jgi:hypothetical protein